MCADDVVCTGAEPLFFLDYLAVGSVDPERVAAIVAGVAEGCRRAGCALLGGETAEHPGVMAEDAFDLAGFCVGVVEDERRLGPDRVRDGDVLIGLASSGVHANGFSLIRDALLIRAGYALDAVVPPLRRPLVDELLEPTAIYAPLVLELAREGVVHAAAHVTGGGIVENLPRVLPEGLQADVAWGSWPEAPVFELLRARTGATEDDLRSTFNLGVGMVLVVPPDRAERAIAHARRSGRDAFPIGLVRA
jgi:phosphoribosylformylglycinamidine cyclo-ligase